MMSCGVKRKVVAAYAVKAHSRFLSIFEPERGVSAKQSEHTVRIIN